MNNELTVRTPSALQSLPTEEQLDLAASLAKRRMWVLIRRAMKQGGLSQADAARILGVNRSTISRMLARPSNISIDKASRLVRAAGSFVTFNHEAVDAADCEVERRGQTRNNYLRIECDQPGNEWVFTFQRGGGLVEPIQAPKSHSVTHSKSGSTKFTLLNHNHWTL